MIKKGDKDICWHLFGIFSNTDRAVERQHNFIDVGKYNREDLPKLMNQYHIDLVCIIPICSETFCYTLSEALLCKVPVIVTDSGALGERVKRMDCGWVASKDASASEILAIIQRIKDRGKEYQAKMTNIQKGNLVKTITEMCMEYQQIYEKTMLEKKCENISLDYQWISEGVLNACGKKVVFDGNNTTLIDELADKEKELKRIYESYTYSIAEAVGNLDFPLRKQIRAVVGKVIKIVRKRK